MASARRSAFCARSLTLPGLASTSGRWYQRFSQAVMLPHTLRPFATDCSNASMKPWSRRRSSPTPAAASRSSSVSNAALLGASSSAQPSVSSTISRPGFTASGGDSGPTRPRQPRSPPARLVISIATCHMSSMQPACGPCVLMLVAWRSPRLMPPCVGFSAKFPQ